MKNSKGEIAKIVCQWTSAATPPQGWEYTGTAKDGRPIFINLSCARPKRWSKKYPAFIELTTFEKTLPQWQRVNIPVEDIDKGHTVRLRESSPGGSDTLYVVERIDSRKKLGLGEKKPGERSSLGAELKRVGGIGGQVVVPIDDLAEIVTYDSSTNTREMVIEYYYSNNQKVIRKQWTDRRKVYNGQSKEVRPWHMIGGSRKDDLSIDGEWVLGKGNEDWLLYHEDEAIETIHNGGIVFAVGGEQSVEAIRFLGLTATCNIGGEGGFAQIAYRLAEPFAATQEKDEKDETIGIKPLLIIWGDRDEVGIKAAEDLRISCCQEKILAITIDPLKIWSDMPEKGDAHDWVEHCKTRGISQEEMRLRLELAIDAAIDSEEEDAQLRRQRQAWNAPVSYKGEIGNWKENKDRNKFFEPLCNFDFQVERELEDSEGGGLVLQVKRTFENRQIRIILNSIDYTKVDGFIDALKKSLGKGVVCNLNKFQLNALIHVRLHEYRTTRSGKLFKRIDRYGQQQDGVWVFRERHYQPNGAPTNEDESGWVFNPSLGKDDFIPCPELAPEDSQALKRLMDASSEFFGEQNINQVLLTIGWTVAGLHSQQIYRQDGCFPLFNAHGEPGSCKTIAAETALSLVGSNWNHAGMLARSSVSALYEHGSRTGSLPFFWDDPDRYLVNEELAKSWYNWKARKVRGNEQVPHSPMGITSNHVFGAEQPATYTRFVRVAFERVPGGNKAAYQKLKMAQATASGAFPQLIALGYPREAIAALEAELLQYLPHAHARIAQSLAIVTWYAQQIVEMTGGTENIKQWVINNCCFSENDSEAKGDSFSDFIDKILSLEAQSLVGDWNLKRGVEREGQKYHAIYTHDVWKLVDQRFKPATYNERSLKSLLLKKGGITDTTVRFSSDRDQVLAYNRLQLTAGQTETGEPIKTKSPGTVPRKAWLIPTHLFKELEEVVTEPVTSVTECNKSPVTPQNPDAQSISNYQNRKCNHVTKKNELMNEKQECTSIFKESDIPEIVSGYSGYTVTEQPETTQNQSVEPFPDPVTPETVSGYTVTATHKQKSFTKEKDITHPTYQLLGENLENTSTLEIGSLPTESSTDPNEAIATPQLPPVGTWVEVKDEFSKQPMLAQVTKHLDWENRVELDGKHKSFVFGNYPPGRYRILSKDEMLLHSLSTNL